MVTTHTAQVLVDPATGPAHTPATVICQEVITAQAAITQDLDQVHPEEASTVVDPAAAVGAVAKVVMAAVDN
ncbi:MULTISPECIES: hypothetical protein [unclassified Pseudomonas]|uniref:hypothetical protein n=1 Tax=unclassified Pseudomonas TaxID=196821 RepID=UPI002B227132|nr:MULTISPECIES: hypothetical protein [unclassified Pseudomonas]MEB0121707.1 hypothetical protein [Pseudomonas sp. CCI1.2]